MKRFDIEMFAAEDPDGVASWPDRWEIVARDWTFPEDAEAWQHSAGRALEMAAPALNLGSGLYRVIEVDPDKTFPLDRVHEFVLTTRTEYDAQPAPRRALEDEREPDMASDMEAHATGMHEDVPEHTGREDVL